MRKLTLLFVISALAIAVIGCGSKDESAPADPNAKTAPAAGEVKPGGAAPSAAGAGDFKPAPGAGSNVQPGTAMKGGN